MPAQVPLVDYLVLDDPPYLRANRCTECAAVFFDRRNACAKCSATTFEPIAVPREGELRAYTIVSFAAKGVPVPYVAALIDCDGVSVRANLVGVAPEPEQLPLGMRVQLTTFDMGVDSAGTQAVTFGFAPINPKELS